VIRAVLFDLDDTLYAEADYVRSGFAAVADELADRGHGDASEMSALFASIHFGEGRDYVFNKAAARIGFPESDIGGLVAVYREHRPRGLAFHDEVVDVLARLRSTYRLGVVTDGWTVIQSNKVAALGLRDHVDHVFLTDSLGRAHWKPHPLPFARTLEALGASANEAIFVGDNPERDVAGARAAGLGAVRIRRGDAYFGEVEDEALKADHDVRDLLELEALLSEWAAA
jgi:putative hydrolase of the HAD superfamily